MSSEAIKYVTDATFEDDVLKAPGLVLVDFWAEWCGPCRAIAPALEQLAEEFAGQVQIAKVNVDDNPAVPARFNIRGIPTLMFFRDGDVVDVTVGAVPKATLAGTINKLLK
jgi:thioredoxin 1